MTERKPCRPANGTDGEIFHAMYCERCEKENFDPHSGQGGCEILLRSWVHDIGEPQYPSEWVYGDDGRPTCTAFEPKEGDNGTAR